VTERYSFIDAEYASAPEEENALTIEEMCGLLEVSKSGYYDWRRRPESETAKRRELLKLKIRALFDFNDQAYGYRRIHQALVRGGELVDDETVRRLMREMGLEPCQPKPWRHSLTEQDGRAGPIPDLVNRDFTAEAPGQKMVGDITYIRTWEGWLYLATVIDCATRKIVGWSMDDNYKTPLIIDAIQMAARNMNLPEGAIFHSDRGSNYTSETFASALKELGIQQSVGRTGICFDNALAESVNGSLKVELVNRTAYRTRKKAHDDIARWIELRYNRTRLSPRVFFLLRDVALKRHAAGSATHLRACCARD
jgi:transposase InsO family protein